MSIATFITHQWIAFWRARNANKSLVLQIILGIFYLLVFLEVAALGIALPFIIEEYMPGKDPITLFCSYIIYYFLIGLLVRFQIQELPSLTLQPYLSQNIKRSRILRFLNVRSLLHLFNFLPLFVFIPFSIVDIAPKFGSITAICFVVAMYALVLTNHFLNMYIKRKSVSNSWWFVSIILAIIILKSLDHLKLISFEKSSASIFLFLINYPVVCIVPIMIAGITFYINNNYLRGHLYIEELVGETKLKASKNFAFLNKLGETGDIIALDIKLILRNKRPRSLIILSGVFLLYGFLVYPQYLQTESYSMLFLFALLITGLFISNYGQFLFSWQSSHFDGMMSYNINMQQYIKAKFTLFVTVCSLQFVMASLYGLMSWKIIPIQTAAFLWSIGVNTFITIYAATFNYKYLNLSRSASMNFQGIGAIQWLQSLGISFGPVLIFFLLNKFIGFWTAILTISGIGIIGLFFHESIIQWLAKEFNTRKHKILEGFRER